MRFLLFIALLLPFAASALDAQTRIAPSLDELLKKAPKTHDAEVLLRKQQYQYHADGSDEAVTYNAILINSEDAARDYGRIAITFNHYYRDLQLVFANTRSPDGTITPVSEDAIQLRVTGGGQDFYSDRSELVFSLPDVLPGSVIEFQHTSQSKNSALPDLKTDRVSPFWFQDYVGGDGWRTDFVVQFDYELTAPNDFVLYEKYYNGFKQPKGKSANGDSTTTHWQMRNVEPISYEPWLAPFHELMPALAVSSHKDWGVISDWTWQLSKDKLQVTDQIRAIATTLMVSDSATVEEKARAVYGYLQNNVRYVFAHLGRGGYEPHFAEDVVESSYGDCKDQSILAVALLNALGVEAYPALVETLNAGQSDTELVDLIFDHMIVYVPATETSNELWIDTTGDSTLFPGMSSYLKGQNAMVIDGKNRELTTIETGFYPNTADLNMTYQRLDNGDDVVKAELNLSGFFEQNMRGWWLHTNNIESELKKLMGQLFHGLPTEQIRIQMSNPQDFETPVSVTAEFQFLEADRDEATRDSVQYGTNFNQLFSLYSGFNSIQTPETRVNRYVDKFGYSLRQTVSFQAPEGLQPMLVQSGGNKIGDWFELTQSGYDTAEGYEVEFDYHLKPRDLTPEQYGRYYRSLEALTQSQAWVVSMVEQDKTRDETLDIGATNQLADILKQTQSAIDTGEFQRALDWANKAVNIDANSGEAWYLLGMAQGLNTELEASNASFEKAAALGYLP